MKFCQMCGKEIMDQAVICPHCGCSVETMNNPNAVGRPTGGNDGLAVASKVFLILACVAQGVFLLPLAWCLPITISICNKMKYNQPIGTGLKVCALIFVSLVAGILLLCRSDEN